MKTTLAAALVFLLLCCSSDDKPKRSWDCWRGMCEKDLGHCEKNKECETVNEVWCFVGTGPRDKVEQRCFQTPDFCQLGYADHGRFLPAGERLASCERMY